MKASPMAELYYTLIVVKKVITIDDVPLKWRDEVQKLIDERTKE